MKVDLAKLDRAFNPRCVVVVGDSEIRRVNIPTHEILFDIAEQNGFKLDKVFSNP